MTIKFSGAVDNFRGLNTLGGWAKCIKDGVSISAKVAVYEDEFLLGESQATMPRGDNSNVGFYITLSKDLDIESLRSGKIKVYAELDGQRHELPLIEPMLDAFAARSLGRQLAGAPDNVIRHLLSELTANPTTPYLKLLAQDVDRANRNSQSGILDGVKEREASQFILPVGLKSPDGAAVVGRDGNLFILGGTNNLIASYKRKKDDSGIQEISREWRSIFRSRLNILETLNAKYIQAIIPDKSSVIPEKFPVAINAPTALLEAVNEAALTDPSIATSYVDILSLFKGDDNRSRLFQKTDSHLSAYGSYQIIKALVDRLGVPIDLSTAFNKRKLGYGDLGSKYTGSPLLEEFWLPEDSDFAHFEQGLVQVESSIPPDGRNGGTRLKWINPSAPLDLRVVAFANSFFERGGGATTLSWWAARCFKEFHFLWESDVNYDYIRSTCPDVVICQTVERFLPKVPEK